LLKIEKIYVKNPIIPNTINTMLIHINPIKNTTDDMENNNIINNKNNKNDITICF